MAYDALNRVTATTDALNHTTTTGYDADGNATLMMDALGDRTSTSYDALDRTLTVQTLAGGVATTLYDKVGNVTGTIDPLGNRTTTLYDALNRQTVETNGDGAATTYQYDAVGNQTTLTDPDGNKTTFIYDALNRQTQQTDPLGHVSTMAYDAAGRVTTATDRLGNVQHETYDGDGQLLTDTWVTSGSTVNIQTYTYDADGNQLTAQDFNGAYTMAYDALDRVTVRDEPFNQSLTYSYDPVGNQTLVLDSQGGVTTSVYNAVNLLTSREFGGTGLTPVRLDETYTATNQEASETRYSDLAGTQVVGTTVYSYDSSQRVTAITDTNSAGTVMASFTYAYDQDSRLTQQTAFGATTTYTYDAASQLIAANTTSYGYDANGNRNSGGYTVGADNQMQTDASGYSYTYDAAGEQIKKSLGSSADTWYYGYNAEGQLTSVTERAADSMTATLTYSVTYTYDVKGQLLEQDEWTATSGTVTTRFANDNGEVWADLNGSSTLTMRYVRPDGINALGARISSSGVAAWYLTDYQGSVIAMTDNNGVVQDQDTYDPFGYLVSETNASFGDRYHYDGEPTDNYSKLQRNNARWYDTVNGRWTRQDPDGFGAGSPNLDEYVNNGPTNATDPSGKVLLADKGSTFLQDTLKQAGVNYAAVKLSDGRMYIDILDPAPQARKKLNAISAKAGINDSWIFGVVAAGREDEKWRELYGDIVSTGRPPQPLDPDEKANPSPDNILTEKYGLAKAKVTKADWGTILQYDALWAAATQQTLLLALAENKRQAGNDSKAAEEGARKLWAAYANIQEGKSVGHVPISLPRLLKISQMVSAPARCDGPSVNIDNRTPEERDASVKRFNDQYGKPSGLDPLNPGDHAAMEWANLTGTSPETVKTAVRSWAEATGNTRFAGGMQAVGGAGMIVAGIYSSPVGGFVLIALGIDQLQAGVRQAYTGEHTYTLLNHTLKAGVSKVPGVNEESAQAGADVLEIVIVVAAGEFAGPKAGNLKLNAALEDGVALKGVKGVPKGGGNTLGSVLSNKTCFVAGTPLLTPDGAKPVEQFQEGDPLLSRHEYEPDGTVEVKLVEKVFKRVSPILRLTVSGRTIGTTREHPFYVVEEGWRCAGDLKPGDMLASHNSDSGVVEAVVETAEVATVYNLRVADYHTYFVGCHEWGFSVWAHNVDCGHVADFLRRNGVPTATADHAGVNAITEALNRGDNAAVRAALRDHFGIQPGRVDGVNRSSELLGGLRDLAARNPVPTVPLSPAGRPLLDEIAHHSQPHWPGETIPAIRQRAADIMARPDQHIALPNGRSIYRQGDTVVTVNNGRVEGSVYRPAPEGGQPSVAYAEGYVRDWIARGGQ